MDDREATDSGTGIEFFGFVGILAPIATLTENPATFGTVVSTHMLYGGEITLWMSNNFGIGFRGAYSGPDLNAVDTQFEGAIPERLGTLDYLVGTVNVTYRIRSAGSAGSLEPYFTVGGGVRHIAVDEIAAPEVEDSTDPAGTIAAGIRVPLNSWFRFRAELRDVFSFYESPATGDSQMQHDMAITFGFIIS